MRQFLKWGTRFSLWFTLFFCGVLLVLSTTAIVEYHRSYKKNSAVAVTLLLALGIALFFIWIYRMIPDRGRKVSGILFMGILGIQVFFLVMVSRPMCIADPARVQNEALAMLKYNNGQMNAENTYMQNYSNNHFLVVFFYYFYKLLGSIGITRVWIPTIILNVLSIDLGIYFTYATAKKIKGTALANMTLLLFLLCPTTYLWLTSVYTNTLSFPFLMTILYFGMDRKVPATRRSMVRYPVLGVLIAVGCFVRPTTVIGVIALVLYHSVSLLREENAGERQKECGCQGVRDRLRRVERPLAGVLLVLFFCGLTWCGCSKLIDRHVDGEKFTERYPVEHWIMMGMNEKSQGGYSRDDRLYTGKYSGLEKKRQADRERLQQRLHHMGVFGVVRQFGRKLTRVWAMGDDDGISNGKYAYHYPPLYEYVMGKDNQWFVFYMHAFRIVLFFLMGAAVVAQLRLSRVTPIFLYSLTFLGAVCFFLIWEAGKRYNICFNGICLFLMAVGVEEIWTWIRGREDFLRSILDRLGIGSVFRVGVVAGIAALLVLGFALSAGYGEKSESQRRMYYCSKMGTDAESINWKGINQVEVMEQTIETEQIEWRKRWNRLKIFFANRNPENKEAEYRIELISLEDDCVSYCGEIAPSDVGNSGSFVMKINSKKMSQTGYKLRLTHIGTSSNLIPIVCKFPLLDPYPYGSLTVNGKERDWDLSMSLYYIAK